MASKKDLTKFLNDLSKEELIKEFEKLYQKFKEVKTFYDIELSGDTTAIVNEVKKKIKNEYMPDRGFGKARSSVVKKLIDDFEKVSIYPKDLVEVNLYRVEMAVEFTEEYGDIDEAFYTSAENAFERTLKLIEKHQLYSEFKLRCKEILHITRNYGWGFYDTLSYLYGLYYQE
jgi:hypothetical protein